MKIILRKNKVLLVLLTFLIFSLSLLIFHKDELTNSWLTYRGYEVGNFVKIDSNRNFYELGKTPPAVKLVDGDHLSIIYIPGRHLNYRIESEEKGYTRNLLNNLVKFSKSNNLNLYYFQTANNLYYTNEGSSNYLDLLALKLFYKSIEGKKVLIGMSFGALLTEYLTCSDPAAFGIAIGGSLRLRDLTSKEIFTQKKEIFTCLKNPKLYSIIGSRDGDFENFNYNNTKGINYSVYKGHHYITDPSINLIFNKLNKIILFNE
jgi:hypothetical protein